MLNKDLGLQLFLFGVATFILGLIPSVASDFAPRVVQAVMCAAVAYGTSVVAAYLMVRTYGGKDFIVRTWLLSMSPTTLAFFVLQFVRMTSTLSPDEAIRYACWTLTMFYFLFALLTLVASAFAKRIEA